MSGIAKIFEAIIDLFGLHLAPWVVPVGFLVVVAACWPWIRVNLRTSDARKLLVKAARERGLERDRMEAEALAMVAGNPDGLVAVAQTALDQGRKELAGRAVVQLRATGKRLPNLRVLERALEPPLPILPSEAVIVIEQMLSTGLVNEARARLAQARRKWPFDDELEALDAKIAALVEQAAASTTA